MRPDCSAATPSATDSAYPRRTLRRRCALLCRSRLRKVVEQPDGSRPKLSAERPGHAAGWLRALGPSHRSPGPRPWRRPRGRTARRPHPPTLTPQGFAQRRLAPCGGGEGFLLAAFGTALGDGLGQNIMGQLDPLNTEALFDLQQVTPDELIQRRHRPAAVLQFLPRLFQGHVFAETRFGEEILFDKGPHSGRLVRETPS